MAQADAPHAQDDFAADIDLEPDAEQAHDTDVFFSFAEKLTDSMDRIAMCLHTPARHSVLDQEILARLNQFESKLLHMLERLEERRPDASHPSETALAHIEARFERLEQFLSNEPTAPEIHECMGDLTERLDLLLAGNATVLDRMAGLSRRIKTLEDGIAAPANNDVPVVELPALDDLPDYFHKIDRLLGHFGALQRTLVDAELSQLFAKGNDIDKSLAPISAQLLALSEKEPVLPDLSVITQGLHALSQSWESLRDRLDSKVAEPICKQDETPDPISDDTAEQDAPIIFRTQRG